MFMVLFNLKSTSGNVLISFEKTVKIFTTRKAQDSLTALYFMGTYLKEILNICKIS